MSRASSRNLERPQCELEDFVNGMFQLSRQAWSQILSPSLQIGKPLWGACADTLQRPLKASRCATTPLCEIPETECPPRCVCELRWEAAAGEKVKGTIRVTNTGAQPQAFSFPATTLAGDGHDSGLAPTVTPAGATLKPGESIQLVVNFTVTNAFQVGRIYAGEVKIRGRYEQCVKLRLDVQPADRAHCDVDHGEIPTRVRAHNWYDHFQCEEPCFDPIPQRTIQDLKPRKRTG